MEEGTDATTTPEGPPSFSVPTSLQEYMGRHMPSDDQRRLVSSSPPRDESDIFPGMSAPPRTFPVRHWFDGSADLSQQESVNFNFPDAVTDRSIPVAASRQNPGNTANMRGALGLPLTGTVDPGCEDEGQFRERDGPTLTEGRRPPTRSASRAGRLRSSVDTRSSVIGSQNAQGDSSGVDGQVQFSAVNVASAPISWSSDFPSASPSLTHGAARTARSGAGVSPVETGLLRRRDAQMPRAEEVLFRDVFSVDPVPLPHDLSSFQRRQALDQPDPRERRSLSDFLREIEEMVRAQRAESGNPEPPVARTPNADQGIRARARAHPLASLVIEHSNSSPERSSGGDGARYFPTDERRRSVRRGLQSLRGRGPQVQRPAVVPNTAGWTELPAEQEREQEQHSQQLAVQPGSRGVGVDGGEYDSGRGSVRANRQASMLWAAASDASGRNDGEGMVQARDANQMAAVFSLGGVGGVAAPSGGREAMNHLMPSEEGDPTGRRQGLMAPLMDRDSYDELRQARQGWWLQLQLQHQVRIQQRMRRHQQQQMEQIQQRYMGNTHHTARGDFSAAIAAARAFAAGVRPGNEAFINTTGARGNAQGGLAPDQQQQQQQEMQSEEAVSSTGGAVVAPEGSTDEWGERQRDLSVMPAYRYWASQRPRLRIQWQDTDSHSDAIRSESLPSDGTLTLTDEHHSAGPSPRGFDSNIPGRIDLGEAASEVETALFLSLTSLGVRRLLVRRGKGVIANSPTPYSGTHRSPEWLNEWLESGGRLTNSDCSGPSGDDLRCPQVGDVWGLLELVIAWWSERVCAVATGIPMSREAFRDREGGREERTGNVAGEPASAAQAVEAVQDLRELARSIVPLARVRDFIAAPGGPTPREAVILKILVVIHEGIAWATDRPRLRHYRDEVIPTALELYASLPQDMLEGVDLEVGHTLPEAMFVITGTARPSWRRWERLTSPAAPQRHARSFPNGYTAYGYTGHGYGGHSYGNGVSIHGRGDSGSGVAGEEDDGSFARGEGRLGDIRCNLGGLEGWLGFVPGPWVIFRLAQTEYLEFYAAQAVALDEAFGGVGDMLC